MLQELRKSTYIHLVLTNQHTLFQHSTILGAGLSDFHYSRLLNVK